MEQSILDLIKKGESETLEFKETLKLDNEIGKTISAFSNTRGGIILIGVSDSGEIIGVTIGKNTIEELANYIKRNTDTKVYPSIKVEEAENKKIIFIEIQENKEKPVFFKNHAYKRVGKTSPEMSSSEIRKLAKESGEKVYWDSKICSEASLEDIDEEKVRWFLRKAKYERNFDVELETPVKEALERLKLIKNGKLTNAAILLFGKNPQKFFLQAETRCARFKGTEPLEFIDMKVFGEDIINQRDNAIEFVKEHIKLHAKIVGTEREETWEYPIEAIREGITNAICHRSYDVLSNVQIRIFDDRIEIWNPGTLPEGLTIEKLKGKHESILRNPLIGKCFFLIRFVEQWGTGTNRIIRETIAHGLPDPVFEDTKTSFILTFRKYLISDDLLMELNERQKKAVEYLIKHEKITNTRYQEINKISKQTATRELKELVDKKIFVKHGETGKGTYYTLFERAHKGLTKGSQESILINKKR
ncbi:MAG: putative DNA binding domain-containing protein [Candidatus Aenigmarchaeota archaeon]|nr:putative DNA binding domain-containing protein [Candidatus Aenigmarchaeota archaeon]